MSQDKRGQGSTDSAGQHPKNTDGNMQRGEQKHDPQRATEHNERDKNKPSGNFSQDRDRASGADHKGSKP